MKYLLPLTKNPDPKGRLGPKEKQDWYVSLVKTQQIFRELDSAKILVISDVVSNDVNEADTYVSTLKDLGIKNEDIIVIRENYETMGQIETAKKIAKEENAELIVISTFLHYIRVQYLFGEPIKHYPSFGIPRPREIITDIILTFGLPLLDFLGLRNWFKRKIDQRRSGGKW